MFDGKRAEQISFTDDLVYRLICWGSSWGTNLTQEGLQDHSTQYPGLQRDCWESKKKKTRDCPSPSPS